jgi:hypothetical protein
MNAVKISVLLIVFCFLFIAIPCYAAESVPYGQTRAVSLRTVSEGNANRVLGNLEPIGNSTQIGNALEAIYSIDARLTDAEIVGSDTLHLNIFLAGWGIPDYNKLYINWTAPNVLKKDKLGNLGSYSLLWGPPGNLTSDFLDSAYFTLPKEAFSMRLPPIGDNGIGLTYIESDQNNGTAPIVFNMNTLNHAHSGDYHVEVTFTYGNQTNLKQASARVEFHVMSAWERNQRKYSIGLQAGIPTVVFVGGIIWAKRQAKKQKKGKH